MARYAALLTLLGGAAYLAIRALAESGVDVVLAKFLVETFLFLVSFSVQRVVVFTGRRSEQG
jgi:hypothetical protein